MPRILIVDDDVKLCSLIAEYLTPMGFDVAVIHGGHEGLEWALRERFDAVVLDLMLPGMDGFQVLQRLRAHSDVPVLMLTGRGDEADRIVGLEMGADDYLPKTFSSRELLARLRAVLRRSTGEPGEKREAPVIAGDLCLDPATRTATVHGHALRLTHHEFELLLLLARARGRVLSREQLMGREFDIFDRSIDVHVASLRRKLGDDPKTPRYIETVRGTGYVMRWPGAA